MDTQRPWAPLYAMTFGCVRDWPIESPSGKTIRIVFNGLSIHTSKTDIECDTSVLNLSQADSEWFTPQRHRSILTGSMTFITFD